MARATQQLGAPHSASRVQAQRLRLTRAVSERILARDPLDEIKRAFHLFDDDNTGKVSLRNLRRVAKEIGENLDDDELCVPGALMPRRAS